MFTAEGSIGIFLLGIFLGWTSLFFFRRNSKDIKGAVLLIGMIAGITALGWMANNKLLDEYGSGVFIGFFGNIVIRLIGKIFGREIDGAIMESTVYKGL